MGESFAAPYRPGTTGGFPLTENRLVTLSFDLNRGRLLSAFFADDDVGAIIRCHFEAERAAIHVLSELTAGRFNPDHNMTRYLSQKLEMLRVVGVDPKILSPLAAHNAHRNKFAHHGQEKITVTQLDEIHGAVLAVLPNFGEMQFRFPDNDAFESHYINLTLRQKYVGNMMMAIAAFAAIPDLAKRVVV